MNKNSYSILIHYSFSRKARARAETRSEGRTGCQNNTEPQHESNYDVIKTGAAARSPHALTHHIDELRELELEPHGHRLRDVDDGPHQLVVVGEKVVVEPLGVGVPAAHEPHAEQRRREEGGAGATGTHSSHPAITGSATAAATPPSSVRPSVRPSDASSGLVQSFHCRLCPEI